MAALLIIFAKEPLAGQVKTRLSPPLAPGAAARLYHCFMEDVVEEMGRLPDVSLALAYTPAGAAGFFRELAASPIRLFPQEGGDLSTRLVRAAARGFAAGFKTLLIRNSDSPDLPGRLILEGKKALEAGGADLVLGPSPDGGYYLVGLKQPCPGIFQGIAWSTPEVLADTLKKARELSLAVQLLPAWPDIDSIADLQAFAARPPDSEAPGRRSRLYARELVAGLTEIET